MFEGWDNVEAFPQAGFLGFVVVGIGVDEYQAVKGANWSDTVIESDIDVIPVKELWSESSLDKEVKG